MSGHVQMDTSYLVNIARAMKKYNLNHDLYGAVLRHEAENEIEKIDNSDGGKTAKPPAKQPAKNDSMEEDNFSSQPILKPA